MRISRNPCAPNLPFDRRYTGAPMQPPAALPTLDVGRAASIGRANRNSPRLPFRSLGHPSQAWALGTGSLRDS